VRAYVVTMAPEVTGRIVELPIVDYGYVRKGDLLMAIDPTNFKIAVAQAEATVQQAQASVQNIEAQMEVQQAQISASQSQLDQAQAVLVFAQQQATRFQTLAQDGWGTVQNAQQFTSQLHSASSCGPDSARKPQSGTAASRVAEGTADERRGKCYPGQGSAQASAGEPRAHADCLAGRWLRDELAGAAR
jgi:multidrug resistance efflux pump